MSGETFYRIDNLGKGNCGYLAYAISLMYMLRHNQDAEMNNRILDGLLSLSKTDSQTLKNILKTSRDEKRLFTRAELLTIQEKLGQKLRDFAADSVVKEYNEHTETSQIFAVTTYPMLLAFKEAVSDKSIAVYQPYGRVADLQSAEIARLPNFHAEIRKYYLSQKDNFHRLFTEAVGLLKPEERTSRRKIEFFERLAEQQTKDFFASNDLLIRYRNELARDRVWASEETLLCMHRAIVGERMEGEVDHRYFVKDNPIEFSIARNGLKMSGEDVDILLNNESNIHWTSLVPASLIADVDERHRPKSSTFRLRSFQTTTSLSKPSSSKKDNDNYPDFDSYDASDVEKQRKLLAFYAKQSMKQKTSSEKTGKDSTSPAHQSETDTAKNKSVAGLQSSPTADAIEEIRKQLSYLALVEGQRANPIAMEIKELISKQEEIKQLIVNIDKNITESSALTPHNGAGSDSEMKRFNLLLEKKQLEQLLQSNEESLMRLFAIEEAEKHNPPSPPKKPTIKASSSSSTDSLDTTKGELQLSHLGNLSHDQPQTEFSASLLLNMFLSLVKHMALLGLAILAGVGVGLLVASSGIAIPAAIGLGVAAGGITALGEYSLFNLGSSDTVDTSNTLSTAELK